MRDLREELKAMLVPQLDKEASAQEPKDDLEKMMELRTNWDFGSYHIEQQKEAGIVSSMGQGLKSMGSNFMSGMATGFPEMASTAGHYFPHALAIGTLGIGGMALLNNHLQGRAQAAQQAKLDESFEDIYKEYPHLKNMPVMKVRRAFDVLAKVAPDMADSSTIAGAYVSQVMESPDLDAEQFNPAALGDIANTQRAIVGSQATKADQVLSPIKAIHDMTPFGSKGMAWRPTRE